MPAGSFPNVWHDTLLVEYLWNRQMTFFSIIGAYMYIARPPLSQLFNVAC